MHIQVPALASWPRSSSGATRTFRGTPQRESPLQTGASISARNVRAICTVDPAKSSPDFRRPPGASSRRQPALRPSGPPEAAGLSQAAAGGIVCATPRSTSSGRIPRRATPGPPREALPGRRPRVLCSSSLTSSRSAAKWAPPASSVEWGRSRRNASCRESLPASHSMKSKPVLAGALQERCRLPADPEASQWVGEDGRRFLFPSAYSTSADFRASRISFVGTSA